MAFKLGNTHAVGKGRPKSRHDSLTYLLRVTDAMDRDALVRKTYDDAMAGDKICLKMIWDCFPKAPYEPDTDHLTLVNVGSEQDVDQALQDTLSMVGMGELSIDNGLKLVNLIERRGAVILKNEIRELEEEEMRDRDD